MKPTWVEFELRMHVIVFLSCCQVGRVLTGDCWLCLDTFRLGHFFGSLPLLFFSQLDDGTVKLTLQVVQLVYTIFNICCIRKRNSTHHINLSRQFAECPWLNRSNSFICYQIACFLDILQYIRYIRTYFCTYMCTKGQVGIFPQYKLITFNAIKSIANMWD